MPSSPSFSRKYGAARSNTTKLSKRNLYILGIACFVIFSYIGFRSTQSFFPTSTPGRTLRASCECVKVEDTLRSSFFKVGEKYPGWTGGRKHEPAIVGHNADADAGKDLVGLDAGNNLDRPKLLGFVGIFTGFDSVERRKALRETWFPSDPDGLFKLEQATGLAFRFIIGRTPDKRKMAELEKEIETYKDFLIIDFVEEYLNLPKKTLAFFQTAYRLFDADFYVKADDDIYLRPDRLATLLAKDRSSTRTYLGCMKKGPVITDPHLKWYEPQGYMLGNEYFYHAYGPIYSLSSEVVASIAVARNDSFRFFINEDVTVGAWMLAMNVNHEDNRDLCDPECTSTSIAVWDIPKCSGLCNPAQKMRELHKIDKCSNSPTLPADE